MNRISDLERDYVIEALNQEFRASTNGSFKRRLEAKFCERFEAAHAIAVNSGTAALHVALVSNGVTSGDEVIVPPLTMASTSMCALYCGAVPVYADVDRHTFTMDPESASNRLSDRTKAVIPVALYGLAPDYQGLVGLCQRAGLSMVEDNAQCFRGRSAGSLVGTFGDSACYSFQASKHVTCGDGGILTTNSLERADRARQFATLGYAGVSARQGQIQKRDIQDPAFCRHESLGYNYRLSELNAAVALAQLERLDELVDQRVAVATLYQSVVSGFDFLVPQQVPEGVTHCYWSYAIVLATDEPDVDWHRFRDLFLKNGGEGYYGAWQLTYREPLMLGYEGDHPGQPQSYEPGLCPNAEYLQPRLMQLQTNHWNLDDAEVQAAALYATAKEFGG